jgi:4-aminobutyrate aminotransferase-like enzyme
MSARPYDNIDAEALQRDADECLLTYGTAFHPELITSTDGIYMVTQSGKRLLDFTSGVSSRRQRQYIIYMLN